jgi:hypothetical protein
MCHLNLGRPRLATLSSINPAKQRLVLEMILAHQMFSASRL